MLVLKPRGSGNWSAITMAIEGKRVSPVLVRVGAFIVIGGADRSEGREQSPT